MQIKRSDELVKDIVALPLSFFFYVFGLIMRKNAEKDLDISLDISYLLLSFPMIGLILQILDYLFKGALSLKHLSIINPYFYIMMVLSNVLWISISYTLLSTILLFFQKQLTFSSIQKVFFEPIQFYTVGSVFIGVTGYIAFLEMVTHHNNLLTLSGYQYMTNVYLTIIGVSLIVVILAFFQTIVRNTFNRFSILNNRFFSIVFTILFLFLLSKMTYLLYENAPFIIKISPSSLFNIDEFCQQGIDDSIDNNLSILEKLSFQQYKTVMKECPDKFSK